jgi:ABC-type dipeptide/oligopeptide/nickel transport system permease component
MAHYVVRRLLMLIPVLFGISILVFITIRQLPGDPALAILGPNNTSQEDIDNLRKQLKLDEPIWSNTSIGSATPCAATWGVPTTTMGRSQKRSRIVCRSRSSS